ncbi:hypothetical protein P618_200573 [Holospora obtusa F1]|uniref:Uncharacterized protein n=1 Tax=Holospora obtusa F1 TaxID=1399147 RepID=W6TEK6_HOLOB|nr:hypothetical protein [Holospora obtusa]ETZ07239.1 hypothetical protein P618_200573 [Holospora obtusa F1]
MKTSLKNKSKLIFILFMANSFDAHAARYQQYQQTKESDRQQTENENRQNVEKEELQEIKLLEERITTRIKEIINNAKVLIPSQSYNFKRKEAKIYKNIPIALKNIREKFGLSGLIAYEHSVAQFWCSFEKDELDEYGGIVPKEIGRVEQAFAEGAGLEANLESSITIDPEKHSDFLEKELEILFSSFEDSHSNGIKQIIKDTICKENGLSEYDIYRILGDSFSSVFLANPKSTVSEETPLTLWKLEFLGCIQKNIYKRKEKHDTYQMIEQTSRDRSEVLAIEERYKEGRNFTTDFSSAYKQFFLHRIRERLFHLQHLYGDSFLALFNLREQQFISRRNKDTEGNPQKLCLDLEILFDFSLDSIKSHIMVEILNNKYSLHPFRLDLACLFAHDFGEANRASEDNVFRNCTQQLIEVGFSEEQLIRILKHTLRDKNFTEHYEKREKFVADLYEKFSQIKTKQNLKNKKNSLDILRKAFVAFPELHKEENATIMYTLLHILPDKDKKDLSDQEREFYEQKLFGIFRLADWRRYAERHYFTDDLIAEARKILNTQAQRNKEIQNESSELREKISALFPEKDLCVLNSVQRMICDHEISEEDAFGMLQITHNDPKKQKEVGEKIISTFSHKDKEQQ